MSMGLCQGDQAYEYQPSLGDVADLRRLVQALTERVDKLERQLTELKRLAGSQLERPR